MPFHNRRNWLGVLVVALATSGSAALATGAKPPPSMAPQPPTGSTIVSTIAGQGVGGYSGDDGPATEAQLLEPRTMAVDAAGNVYIADTLNHVVRRVDASGAISTFAGVFPGPVAASDKSCPAKFSGDGGSATQASLRCPRSIAIDGEGNVIIADSGNNRVRKVDANGIITTVAGNGERGLGGDGGLATQAQMDDPEGLAIDREGNLLIADTNNNRVRKVDGNGVITTIAGSGAISTGAGASARRNQIGDYRPATQATLYLPGALSVGSDGSIFIAEPKAHRTRRIDVQGTIFTLAGTGAPGFYGDGSYAQGAQLTSPRGVAVDGAGNVFIADSLNGRIRRVDTRGMITTIAGTGEQGFGGDGGPAAAAKFFVPRAVAVDARGDLLVADTDNHRIRRIEGVAVPVTGLGPAAPVPPAEGPPPEQAPAPAAPPAAPAPAPRSGYWMLASDGRLYSFGDAVSAGDPSAALAPGHEAVDLEATPSGRGYWVVDDSGRVFTYGDAVDLGGIAPGTLVTGERVTSMSVTPKGDGYWLFTSRGRVRSFGAAPALGDMSWVALNGPVLDSVATPSGQGYYMVASDGGVFTFGDARFHGSMGDRHLNAPVRSLVPDGDGVGYWLVASDGGIFAFEAPFRGSMGNVQLNRPVTGMVRLGAGYLMVGADGGVFNFSDRPFLGSLGDRPPSRPIVSVAALP